MKKFCIIGAGGFGRETLFNLADHNDIVFMVDDLYYDKDTIMGVPVVKRSEFNPKDYLCVVAIGDPATRRKMVESLAVYYTSVINGGAIFYNGSIGVGAIVTAGVIVTCNVVIGKHAHLNLNTTIGHDCRIGDYFTTAPAVNISGNCTIGDNVYIGTGAVIKQGLTICSDVIIGMGAVVTKSILQPGVYFGNPLIKYK